MMKLIVGFRNFRMRLKMETKTIVHIHREMSSKETAGNMTEQLNVHQHQRNNIKFRKHPITMKSQIFSDVSQGHCPRFTDVSKVHSALISESL